MNGTRKVDRSSSTVIAGWLLLLAVGVAQAAPKKESAETVMQNDGAVDRAALLTQLQALARLNTLKKSFAHTPREPLLLLQIAQTQRDSAAIEYRIAYAEGLQKKREPDLSKYKKRTQEVVKICSAVIRNFPRSDFDEKVHLMRAIAYGDLKNDSLAKKDYEYLSSHFEPSTAAAERANMALADYATEEKDHVRAVAYLKKLEANTESARYPFVLRKLAWGYFNVRDYSSAVSYLARHVKYYDEKEAHDPDGLSTAEEAFREASLLDTVSFWMTALQSKDPNFELAKALPSFRDLSRNHIFGKMIQRFTKLLRVNDLADLLVQWKTQVISEESARPESLDVVMMVFEFFLNKRDRNAISMALHDFETLDASTKSGMRKYESFQTSKQLLLSAAAKLQKMIASNKNESQVQPLNGTLRDIYQTYINLADAADPNLPQVHYNLAETLFTMKDFEGSAQQYHWVLDQWNSRFPIALPRVKLKLINSKYQSLSAKGLIPKTLTPSALSGVDTVDKAGLDKDFHEWMDWVDAYQAEYGKKDDSAEVFSFQAIRTCYSLGLTAAAVKMLLAMIWNHPKGQYSVPAATLVLDTLLVSQNWREVVNISERLMGVKDLGDKTFHARLETAAGDAFYKLVEDTYRTGDFKNTSVLAEKFIQTYQSSQRLPEVLLINGHASFQTGNKTSALKNLDDLISRFPTSSSAGSAHLFRASLEEERYDFAAAVLDYEAFLATRPAPANEGDKDYVAQGENIQKRLFQLRWLARTSTAFDCDAFQKTESLAFECDRYQALVALHPVVPGAEEGSKEKALHGFKANQALWAAVALRWDKKLTFQDRQNLLRLLSSGWDDLEPLSKLSTISILIKLVPKAFGESRKMMTSLAPLRATKEAISRRVALIRELETTANLAIKLPWAHIRVSVTADLASAYQDFSTEIKKLAPPRGSSPDELVSYRKSIDEIVTPFDDKARELHAQALEVAKEAAVDTQGIAGIDPDSDRKPASQPDEIAPSLLEKLAEPSKDPEVNDLRKLWSGALENGNWGEAAFFLQEFKQKAGGSPKTAAVMQAILFSSAGADSEALSDLEALIPDLSSPNQKLVRQLLFTRYTYLQSTKKADKISAAIQQAEKLEQEEKEKTGGKAQGGSDAKR